MKLVPSATMSNILHKQQIISTSYYTPDMGILDKFYREAGIVLGRCIHLQGSKNMPKSQISVPFYNPESNTIN